MSFSVLTTAMAVAAAPMPGGEGSASVAAVGFESTELVQAPAVVGPAQPTEQAQSTGIAQPTASSQSTDPAPPAPAEIRLPAPPAPQGEIVVTGRRASPDDPLEDLNSTSFELTQKVDDAIVAPVALAYKDAVPSPFRSGLRNFLHNLGEPVIFLNFMLQLKPGKAAETLGRFAINTTLGAAGIVDVARRKPFSLPYRDNGFANTLGYYGVKPGPYFYLPLVGSTTLRDFIGNRLDVLVYPLALGRSFGKPQYMIPVAVLGELDHRIEFDDELAGIRAAQDPYVAARTYYLRKRQAEIDALHGRPGAARGTDAPVESPPK